MNEQTALVTTNGSGNGYGSALAHYADRDEVRELADRLMAMHPAANDVGVENMRAAAQLAILVDASPLPGTNEISVWKDKDGRICFSLGINYFRRKTQELGGVLWYIQPRQMNAKERDEYSIPKDITAAICKAVRAEDMLKYKAAGFTTNEVWNMCAASGISTVGQNEYSKKGRPAVWSALKRAEVDLYRQLFPIMMRQLTAATEKVKAVVTVEGGPRQSLEEINRDLFGDNPPPLWEEQEFAAGEEILEGEFEEATPAQTVDPVTGEINPAVDFVPMDWMVLVSNAQDVDVWAAAVYQLTSQVTEDANQVKRGYARMFGEFDPVNNLITWEVFKGYVSAVADGAKKSEAFTAAKVKFQERLAALEKLFTEQRAANLEAAAKELLVEDDLFGEAEPTSVEQ